MKRRMPDRLRMVEPDFKRLPARFLRSVGAQRRAPGMAAAAPVSQHDFAVPKMCGRPVGNRVNWTQPDSRRASASALLNY